MVVTFNGNRGVWNMGGLRERSRVLFWICWLWHVSGTSSSMCLIGIHDTELSSGGRWAVCTDLWGIGTELITKLRGADDVTSRDSREEVPGQRPDKSPQWGDMTQIMRRQRMLRGWWGAGEPRESSITKTQRGERTQEAVNCSKEVKKDEGWIWSRRKRSRRMRRKKAHQLRNHWLLKRVT